MSNGLKKSTGKKESIGKKQEIPYLDEVRLKTACLDLAVKTSGKEPVELAKEFFKYVTEE
jgi:hypothetical protein